MPNDVARITLDARYSQEGAQAAPWSEAVSHLEQAGRFWVSTVRADGRPHVTPGVAVWTDRALWFTSGRGERMVEGFAKGPFGHTRWDFDG